jgi:hypothetical protein
MGMRRLLVVLLLVAATRARALDAPIAGDKLTLVWNAQLQGKLVFISKDPTFLFPAIGSADDPGTGTPGGAVVWLFAGSPPSFGNNVSAPGGAGWKSSSARTEMHRWSNPDAPFGPSPIRSIVMKRGRRLKVVSKLVPMTETPPLGRLAIRIDIGSLRNCAVFEAATIRRDEPFHFAARGARKPIAADCDAAISGAPTTTTTTIPLPSCAESTPFYPVCGGDCPAGSACGPNAVFGNGLEFECRCLPAGATPCSVSGYPLCGGACLDGNVCQAFALESGGGSLMTCACVDPARTCGPPPPATCVSVGACPSHQVCFATTMPSFLCGCGTP